MLDGLKEYWFLLVAGVGISGWLYRLEARILGNDREIRRIWEQRREDMLAAKESRDATNSLLNEMRNDIKTLLRGRHNQ